MKLSSYLILTSSLANADVLLPVLDTFPAMAGSAPATDNNTKSCFQCVRAGHIWCSAKWNYQQTTIKTPKAETSDG